MELMFNGLTMPVFTAFGWAGEEAALKFAFSQLQLFVQSLHQALPREMQTYFPNFGVDEEAQCAYLARNQAIESDLYITFHARPMAFRITVNMTDRAILLPSFKRIQEDASQFFRVVSSLDPEWSLRLQQMEYNAETDESIHYKDLYKDSVATLTLETAADLVARAEYLNSERDRWLAPFYMMRSMPSEFVSSMGSDVVREITKELDSVRPALFVLSKPTARATARPKKKKATPVAATVEKVVVDGDSAEDEADAVVLEQISYVATLKPLHLRKGFINMTPAEWPFFTINARTTTREVTIVFDNQHDKDGTVWRLSPNDQARLVLGNKSSRWLRDYFEAEDKIKLVSVKQLDGSIEVGLEPIV
jgi:hypothetical protein